MVNRGRIPYEYKDSGMHYAGCENGIETEVEGIIFYSEGSGTEKNNVVVSSIKEHKAQREGLIRINVDGLIEFTDLSWAPEESIIRKIYIRSMYLKLTEAQDKADEGHIIGH